MRPCRVPSECPENYHEGVRRVSGAIAQAAAAGVLVGTAVWAVAAYNSDSRSIDEIAEFNAAVTRASSDAIPFEGRSDDWGRIAIYPVIEDGTLNPVPEGVAADIWSAFARMTTPRFAAENMSAMRIASAPDNPVAAEVERASVRPLRWTLTVNLASQAERDDYLRTLVHEYAHLLTLDDDQLDAFAAACTTTRVQEGCLLEGSTLQRFFERFWEPYAGLAPEADSVSQPENWHHYYDHADDFVTVYAAMNVVEDIAESFTEFVVRDRPSPDSGTWAKKILFFWEDPEYVAIRAHIRGWFGPELPEPLLPTSTTHRG